MATKTVTLSLKRSLILEAVKTETYKTGKADTLPDGSTNNRVYNEQAGNDEYHERKLTRTLHGAVAALEAAFTEFVDGATGSILDTLSTGSDNFTISFVTSSRYNDGLSTPLAHLSMEFIINRMTYMWWLPIKPELAQFYLALANANFSDIRATMTKSAPAASTTAGGAEISYDDITGTSTID